MSADVHLALVAAGPQHHKPASTLDVVESRALPSSCEREICNEVSDAAVGGHRGVQALARLGDESSCVPLGDDVVRISGGGGQVKEIVEVVVLPCGAGMRCLSTNIERNIATAGVPVISLFQMLRTHWANATVLTFACAAALAISWLRSSSAKAYAICRF